MVNILKKHKYVIGLAVCLFTSLILLTPLFREGFFVTDDGDWMVIRLSAFYQSLVNGQLPVRFLGRLNNSFGYPVSNFLYPGFLYIGSLFQLVGFSSVAAIKLIIAVSVLAAGVFMYIWKAKEDSPVSSLVGAVSLISSPYLLFNLYSRGSVGELLAIAFGVLGFVLVRYSRPYLLAIAIGGLITAHNSLALLFFLALIGYVWAARRRRLYISLLAGIGLSAFFWFPALYERQYVLFDALQISDPSQFYVTFEALPLLSIVHVVGVVMFLLLSASLKNKREYFYLSMLFFLTVFFSSSGSSFLWGVDSFAKLFQFPYRFLALNIVVGGVLTTKAVSLLSKKNKWIAIVSAVCVLGFSLAQIQESKQHIEYTNHEIGYYTTNEATTTVAGEYMPRWVLEPPAERAAQRIIFYEGRGEIRATKATHQHIEAVVDAQVKSMMQINSVYYPGWGVTIDGEPVTITYDNVNGLIQFEVPEGRHEIFAAFRETFPRFLADIVSISTLLTIIGHWWLKRHEES